MVLCHRSRGKRAGITVMALAYTLPPKQRMELPVNGSGERLDTPGIMLPDIMPQRTVRPAAEFGR